MISKIEQAKLTTEYEGFIKESSCTGNMELDQATVLHQVKMSVGPGGNINKAE